MSRGAVQIDHVDWQVPIRHYQEDRLVPAYESARRLGAGLAGRYLRMYRMIEAEYMTRKSAEKTEVNEWLTVEVIPDEIGDRMERLLEISRHACDEAARRLGWQHGPNTLISVLAAESEAPWTIGRAGFCVHKKKFDKICIPNRVVWNEPELYRTLLHEYTHVATYNMSEGRVPRWLDEALATTIEGSGDLQARQDFLDSRVRWLGVHELAGLFVAEDDDNYTSRSTWYAYQQSFWIGLYLVSLKGEAVLGDLMRAFANNSFLTDVIINFKGQDPAVEALRETYGLTLEELFEKAREYMAGYGTA